MYLQHLLGPPILDLDELQVLKLIEFLECNSQSEGILHYYSRGTMGQSILYPSNPTHRDSKSSSILTRVVVCAQPGFVSEDPKCSDLATTGSFLSSPNHPT